MYLFPNKKFVTTLLLSLSLFITVIAQNNAQSFNIEAIDGLQFSIVRFTVKPKSGVIINLSNVSDMSHNLIITKPGKRSDVVSAALQLAGKGPQMNYIPETPDVLWAIPVINPGQTKSVSFTAPSEKGIYPFVCTYPGHGFVMYGAMYVSDDEKLPEITTDVNIPESRRKNESNAVKQVDHAANHTAGSPHPYPLNPPYLYNAFIDGASPSAIAVHLPNDLSYCWDAGTCRLQIAWKGGFIDMSDLWKGHFDASAKILGDIFFRDNTDHPIRTNENTEPVIEYKGYRLINRYPQFHYTLNGMDIYELVRAKEDGFGLIREFSIPNATQTIWFITNRNDASIEFDFSKGTYSNNKLKLSPSEAKNFSVTMTSYFLAYKKQNK